jgi:hypothetical protein
LVVSTTNAIGLGDVAAVQALIPDFPVLAVEIAPGKGGISSTDNRVSPVRTGPPSTRFRPKILDPISSNRNNTQDFFPTLSVES